MHHTMKGEPDTSGEMKRPGFIVGAVALALWSAALLGPWLFLELARAQHSRFWCGTQGSTWIVVGCAAGVAALFVFVAGLAVRGALERFLKMRLPAPAGAFAGMVFFWAVLLFVADPVAVSGSNALTLPALMAGAGLLARRLFRTPDAASGFVALAAMASGIAANELAGQALLLSEHRGQLAEDAATGWVAVVFFAGLAIMALPRGGHRLYRTAVVALLASSLPLWLAAQLSTPFPVITKHTSVVVITIDALRADHCSTYGSTNPTPTIDRVAEGGVVFERAYVTAPWTLPSVYSMFASDYSPLWLPGQDFKEWGTRVRTAFFDIHEPTPAELYREKEYRTAAIIGNSRRWGICKGRGYRSASLYGRRPHLICSP